MTKKAKLFLILACAALALFAVFTVLVTHIDVRAIGPENSSVGFSSLNEWGTKTFPYSETWHHISDVFGYLAFLYVGGFALVGLCQWIKRKNMFKVDAEVLILGGFYLTVGALYLLFEFCPVNFRPVILDEGLESSFPSSHNVLAVCVTISAIARFAKYFKGKKALTVIADAVTVLLAVGILAGRLLAGVHWLSDIIGGILISASLLLFDRFALILADEHKKAE